MILFIALTPIGCSASLDDVKEQFSHEFTCPTERIEARARPELKPSMLERPASPPAEIAADPGRRAVWQAERDKHLAYIDGDRVFEARGCGHQTLYTCHRNQNRGWVSCDARPYGEGITRW